MKGGGLSELTVNSLGLQYFCINSGRFEQNQQVAQVRKTTQSLCNDFHSLAVILKLSAAEQIEASVITMRYLFCSDGEGAHLLSNTLIHSLPEVSPPVFIPLCRGAWACEIKLANAATHCGERERSGEEGRNQVN